MSNEPSGPADSIRRRKIPPASTPLANGDGQKGKEHVKFVVGREDDEGEDKSLDSDHHDQTNSSRRESLDQERSNNGTPSHSRTPRKSSTVYLGSYVNLSTPQSRRSSGQNTPSTAQNPFTIAHLEQLSAKLRLSKVAPKNYGLEETRDGFFDANFGRPPDILIPESVRKPHTIFSFESFVHNQGKSFRGIWHTMLHTRKRMSLFQSVLAYMIAYIICLIPIVRAWLGRGAYFMVLATIINHSGRTVGAQIEGTFLCVLGAALGLATGTLTLFISTSTGPARANSGALIATALLVLLPILAWWRARYVRFFQFYIASGLALLYMTTERIERVPDYKKLRDFAVPWVLGLAVCLLVNFTVFPDSGGRDIAYVPYLSLVNLIY